MGISSYVTEKDAVTQCVDRGAELLDEKVPGWADVEFNWETFNLNLYGLCVVGQLAASGVAGTFNEDSPSERYVDFVKDVLGFRAGDIVGQQDHGFFMGGQMGWDDAVVTEVWRDAVEKRMTA